MFFYAVLVTADITPRIEAHLFMMSGFYGDDCLTS